KYSSDLITNTDPSGDIILENTKALIMEDDKVLELQQKFNDAMQEIQSLKTSQTSTKIVDLNSEITSLKTKLTVSENTNKMKDEENKILKDEKKITDEKMQKIEDADKAKLVDKLFMLRDAKNQPRFKKADLEAKTLDVLKIMEDTIAPSGAFNENGNQAGFSHADKDNSNISDKGGAKVIGSAVPDLNKSFFATEGN
ncbi:MAG: hypothetical protein KAJ19_28120, partial [Gammaproteobacteria bacterium]|nr:hypothetical protein [Gammaproteobacteria bacterium]